ncbi:hypothetical protein [Okeania sp. KiyG1]|nr:hypothetical protein [Okeania sp. KiyG1]
MVYRNKEFLAREQDAPTTVEKGYFDESELAFHLGFEQQLQENP